MDVNGIRLRNYKRQLLAFRDRPDQAGLPEHGLLKRFSEAAGVSPRYLSHVNNGRKNIGADLARRMEVGLGLPHGYLDREEPGNAGLTVDEREFYDVMVRLYQENPVEMQALLMRYMAGKMAK